MSGMAWAPLVFPIELLTAETSEVQQPGLLRQGFVMELICYPPSPLLDALTPFSIEAVSLPITCLPLDPLLPPPTHPTVPPSPQT